MTRRITLYTYFTILFSDPVFRSRLEDGGRHFVVLITSVVFTGFFLLTVDAAMAQPIMADVRTVVVQTGDLDLSRPAGQKTSANRIRAAERRICDSGSHGVEAMAAEAK
jgi:UrcA family protein